jgi:hypothetical protein
MSSQLTAKQHPRPYGHVAVVTHLRGLSTGCRAWRGRSACCGRMSRCPALSRAFRLLGLRRGLGVGVETWSGRRTPLPAADRRRAGHRPRESRTSASRVTSREIYANRIPLPDPAGRGPVDTADQMIAAGQAAERQATLTRPEQAERARANPAPEQRKSDVPVPADRGSSATCQEEMRPRKGQADDAHAGV